MKILLLDTDEDIRTNLKSFLESKGHNVETTDNPVSALSICKLFDIQLLIFDYFSSDENYSKMVRSIHDKEIVTKTMILSCNPLSLTESQHLMSNGIDCIFLKPIDPEIILNTIEIFEKSLELNIKHSN